MDEASFDLPLLGPRAYASREMSNGRFAATSEIESPLAPNSPMRQSIENPSPHCTAPRPRAAPLLTRLLLHLSNSTGVVDNYEEI